MWIWRVGLGLNGWCSQSRLARPEQVRTTQKLLMFRIPCHNLLCKTCFSFLCQLSLGDLIKQLLIYQGPFLQSSLYCMYWYWSFSPHWTFWEADQGLLWSGCSSLFQTRGRQTRTVNKTNQQPNKWYTITSKDSPRQIRWKMFWISLWTYPSSFQPISQFHSNHAFFEMGAG